MDYDFELQKLNAGFSVVVGTDEVGRGCLAGPVVSAAVIITFEALNSNPEIRKIKDSKLLSAKKREELAEVIKQCCIWSIAEVEEKVIDEMNIHNASLLVMRKAVIDALRHCEESATKQSEYKCGKLLRSDALARNDVLITVDGKFIIPELHMKQEAVVGGDNKILSIAAASIIAKVYRDELMQKLHIEHPEYNFSKHKGYATLYHRQMIQKHGLSPRHRLSFCKNFI